MAPLIHLPWRFLPIAQSWDTATKTPELNDYSVCTTWGVDRDGYCLTDLFCRRLNFRSSA
jgi:phage terminase large subunit-like protein